MDGSTKLHNHFRKLIGVSNEVKHFTKLVEETRTLDLGSIMDTEHINKPESISRYVSVKLSKIKRC